MHIAAAFRINMDKAAYVVDALGEKKANPNLQDKYGRWPFRDSGGLSGKFVVNTQTFLDCVH